MVQRSDGAILLCERRTLRGFELPGGGLMRGEEARQGLAREVREETGIEVEVEDRIGRYTRRGIMGHRAEVYRCTPRGGRLAKSFETPVVGWFRPDRLPSTLFPWFRKPLLDALAGERDAEHKETLGFSAVLVGMRVDLRTRRFGSETGAALEVEPAASAAAAQSESMR